MGTVEEYIDQAPDSRSARLKQYLGQNYRAYLFLAPAAIFLISVVGFPIYETFRMSLFRAPADTTVTTFIGLEHYTEMLDSDIFYKVLWQTGRWVFVGVALKTIIGLFIALHLQHDIKGRKFFRTAFLIPWGIPYAISAVVFRWFQHPQYGTLNSLLLELNLIDQPIGILGDPAIAWIGVIMADVWIGIPFMAIIFLAGLQSIPEELYEAAAVDGAERWEQFRYVTLPQLKPVILIATLLSTIWTFVSFDTIWVMTRGGPLDSTSTLVIHIYRVGIENGNFGEGAAYSVVGFLMLLVFAMLYLRVYTRGDTEL